MTKRMLFALCTSLSLAASADDAPTIEFAFEERVTLDAPVVVGDTAYGHRQYIPITGGTVTGPKLKGQVVRGGWDFQLTYAASNCTQLSADYFLKADDGTLIHVSTKDSHARVRHARFSGPGSRRRRARSDG